ncbi:MAG TPA: hypothetical protein EYH34_14805 [Planctomycetes bacterium]|nr:hypothetical protein [Planctomycetota bacterium]
MRPAFCRLIGLQVALWLLSLAGLDGQAAGITRWHHPWGRFQPGAWKLVRVTTQTFEDSRTLVSLTETRTTLQGVDRDGVTLLIEVGVQVAGRWFDTQPSTVKQDFFGQLVNHKPEVVELDPAEVAIQDRQIPCRVFRVETRNETSRTVSTIYFSDAVEPYVLRRNSVKLDLETGKRLSETTVEVTETDVTCQVLGVLRRCAQVKWVHRHPAGTSTTLAITCTDVPGAVVCHTLKEYDKAGKLVRQSHLELVDYGFQTGRVRRGLFGRRPTRDRWRARRSGH